MFPGLLQGDDDVFSALCRERNWKRTAQRRAVFQYLCGNREHPTVEAVWHGVRAALPNVSLDSVYRILDDFADTGLVRRLEGAKAVRYDADTAAHEHFLCSRCGKMYDFVSPGVDAAALCCAFGRVDSVELTVYGVCNECLSSTQGEEQ